MTKNEIIRQYKSEALNSISKIYHPKYHFRYDEWDESTLAEQREDTIRYIIDKMNNNIEKTKKKFKEIELKKTKEEYKV